MKLKKKTRNIDYLEKMTTYWTDLNGKEVIITEYVKFELNSLESSYYIDIVNENDLTAEEIEFVHDNFEIISENKYI